jgi:SET family sugar efflux transporter-like MFS transporter
MPTSTAVTRRSPDFTSLAFLAAAFLTGIAGALQTPTLSLFLATEVNVRPAMVGLFFTGSAVIGILVSQFLASRSDKRGDRKSLIFFCCMLGALGFALFAWNRNYYLLLAVGVLLTSFGSTANPQMFALAREHADRTGREAVMFTSIMRAQVSLAWVIGPPIAFALALGFGFKVMYLAGAAAFVLCGALVWKLLPSMPKAAAVGGATLEAPRQNRRDALLLFAACTLMWTANSMYLINMPLYMVHELQLPERLTGILMGTAAGLEIPTMLLAGLVAKRFGKRFLMRGAVGAGLLFYIGLLFITGSWQLIALQLLNAVFIGVLAGIGMLYFQDLLPGQAGAATTLFTNTIRVGWIIAGSIAGTVAEIWNYHAVFYSALAMVAGAVLCLWKLKDA